MKYHWLSLIVFGLATSIVLASCPSTTPQSATPETSTPEASTSPITLVEPKTRTNLPRIVDIQISLNSSDGNIKDLILHTYQKGLREDKWHCVKTASIGNNIFIGEVWLGGPSLGRNETFLLKVILSNEEKVCSPGNHGIDVVLEKDFPLAKYEQTFTLKRGNK